MLDELVGDLLQVAVAADADHGLAAEAEHQRVGHRDDLHDAGLLQPLHALPDGGLGQPDRLADRRVGLAAVGLQLLDDPLGDLVERRRDDGAAAARAVGHPITSLPEVRVRYVPGLRGLPPPSIFVTMIACVN